MRMACQRTVLEIRSIGRGAVCASTRDLAREARPEKIDGAIGIADHDRDRGGDHGYKQNVLEKALPSRPLSVFSAHPSILAEELGGDRHQIHKHMKGCRKQHSAGMPAQVSEP